MCVYVFLIVTCMRMCVYPWEFALICVGGFVHFLSGFGESLLVWVCLCRTPSGFGLTRVSTASERTQWLTSWCTVIIIVTSYSAMSREPSRFVVRLVARKLTTLQAYQADPVLSDMSVISITSATWTLKYPFVGVIVLTPLNLRTLMIMIMIMISSFSCLCLSIC